VTGPGVDEVAFYAPLPLSDQPPTASLELIHRATAGRLAFYIGAGLSMSPPTALPRGSEVQARIADRARRLLGVEVTAPVGGHPTLEELGETALASGPDVLDRLRELAADAVDFVGSPPNFAHDAVALLLREGIVQVLTVNWDCGLERAGRDLGYEIRRVVRQDQRTYGPSGPVIDKLNGCASEPSTMRITQGEVDVPQQWAAHRVGAVLTDSTVIFIGLGTVGAYVAEGVERMLVAARGAPVSVLVVNPTLSEDWKEALGDHANTAHQAVAAERFLDDLLRAAVRLALTRAIERANRWAADGHACAVQLAAGGDRVFDTLEKHAALPVWRWWRDGACGQASGKPFILDRAGEVALATVCALVADHELIVSGDGDSLVVELPDRYLEVCSWPGEPAATVVTRQADRIRKRRRRGVYRDLEKRIVSVSVGHDGPLPGVSATMDIAGSDAPMTDIFDGSERLLVSWVPGDTFAQGLTMGVA
jgi:hypothetical protein